MIALNASKAACTLCGTLDIEKYLPTRRMARVLICLYREHLVALHGFINKTDLATARKRQKELER